jgi:hypothetical protein
VVDSFDWIFDEAMSSLFDVLIGVRLVPDTTSRYQTSAVYSTKKPAVFSINDTALAAQPDAEQAMVPIIYGNAEHSQECRHALTIAGTIGNQQLFQRPRPFDVFSEALEGVESYPQAFSKHPMSEARRLWHHTSLLVLM